MDATAARRGPLERFGRLRGPGSRAWAGGAATTCPAAVRSRRSCATRP